MRVLPAAVNLFPTRGLLFPFHPIIIGRIQEDA